MHPLHSSKPLLLVWVPQLVLRLLRLIQPDCYFPTFYVLSFGLLMKQNIKWPTEIPARLESSGKTLLLLLHNINDIIPWIYMMPWSLVKKIWKKIMKRILRHVEKLLLPVNSPGATPTVFSMSVLLIIKGTIFSVPDSNPGPNMAIFGVFLGRKERIILVKLLNKAFSSCIRWFVVGEQCRYLRTWQRKLKRDRHLTYKMSVWYLIKINCSYTLYCSQNFIPYILLKF